MSFVNTNFLPYYYINTSNLFTTSLGIGTDSTSYNLEVVGDINFTGSLYQNGTEFVSGGGGSSVWTSNEDSTIYYSSNDVGIGTTNPTKNLEVFGDIKSTNYILDIDYTNSNDILGNVGINILNRNYTVDPIAQWAVSVDSTSGDGSTSVAVDADYNVYLAGYYGSGAATIYNTNDEDSGLTLRATSGNSAAFVVKYNSSGQAQWGVSVDGLGYDYGQSIAVDADGNVYLGGYYSYGGGNTATIYNANNQASELTLRATSGNSAAFVVKFNSSGIAQWAVSVDSTGSEFGQDVAVDTNGNVYLSGEYGSGGSGTAVIYNANNTSSGLTLRASSNGAAFVVKYNSSGIAQWFVSVDGSDRDVGNDVAVDADGNVYLAGFYGFNGASATIYNSNDTDSGLTLRATSGYDAAFVVKYNSSGIAQWAVSVDGTGYDSSSSVVVDADGNVYLSGEYGNSGATATIYNTNNTSSGLTLRATSGYDAAFAVKYNSSGIAQWAVSVDGTDIDNGSSVVVDADGNVYLAGQYNSTGVATIYNTNNVSSGLTLRDPGGSAAFVVKYNSSGIAQWAVSVDGTGYDYGKSIAVDSSGNVYLGGRYGSGAATIYNLNNEDSGLTLRATSGSYAAFVVKYSQTNMRFKLLNYSSSDNDGTIKRLVNTTSDTIPVGVYSSDGTTLQYIIQLPPNSARQYVWYNNAWTLINY
jgi:hypothetical protein